jgi:hypothetical protein
MSHEPMYLDFSIRFVKHHGPLSVRPRLWRFLLSGFRQTAPGIFLSGKSAGFSPYIVTKTVLFHGTHLSPSPVLSVFPKYPCASTEYRNTDTGGKKENSHIANNSVSLELNLPRTTKTFNPVRKSTRQSQRLL